jgi:hypothetical protein
MSAIIETQPYDIVLETGITLTGATDPKIIYKKPVSKTIGELVATVEGTTKLKARVTGALNNEVGYWYFHAKASFVGMDQPILGEAAIVKVEEKFTSRKAL